PTRPCPSARASRSADSTARAAEGPSPRCLLRLPTSRFMSPMVAARPLPRRRSLGALEQVDGERGGPREVVGAVTLTGDGGEVLVAAGRVDELETLVAERCRERGFALREETLDDDPV